MKKIILVIVLFLLSVGAVSASSINGEFNGNPIVKLTTGFLGSTEIATEIPAFIYEGNTMVPISALKELGADVRWIGETYTVRVNIPKQATKPNINLLFLADLLIKNSVSHIEYLAKAPEFTRLNVYYTGSFLDENYISKDFKEILLISVITDAAVIQIEDNQNTVMWAYSTYAGDYANGRITYEEFKKNLHISVPPTTNQPSAITPPSTSDVIESKIDGDFEGFESDKIFKLQNGQIWQQTDYTYKYSYKYSPKVTIYKDGSSYYMIVDGVEKKVKVNRLK